MEKVIIHCFSIKLEFRRVLGFLEEGKLKKKPGMINVHACLARIFVENHCFILQLLLAAFFNFLNKLNYFIL